MIKRVIKLLIVGIGLGLLLLVIQLGLDIDKELFMRYYWLAAPVIIVGAVLFNVGYNLSYQKRLRQAIELLDAKKPKEFVTEVEKLLCNAKGNTLVSVLKLNLAAGYMEMKAYEQAIEILEALSKECLKGKMVKFVHQLNLFISYFYTEQYQKALEVYASNQKLFEAYKMDKVYGGHMVVVDVLILIINEQYEQAETLLNSARDKWNQPRLQDAFNEIQKFLDKKKLEKV